MSAAVSDLVRAAGFRPTLRRGLQFRPGESPGFVVVTDPASGRRWDLSDAEFRIAREMNGLRDIDQLARHVKVIVPSSTRDQIQQLAIKMAGLDLLANVAPRAPSAPMAPVIPFPRTPPPPVPRRSNSPTENEFESEVPTQLTTNDPFVEEAIEAALLDDMLGGATELTSASDFDVDDPVFSSAARAPDIGASRPTPPAGAMPIPAASPRLAPQAPPQVPHLVPPQVPHQPPNQAPAPPPQAPAPPPAAPTPTPVPAAPAAPQPAPPATAPATPKPPAGAGGPDWEVVKPPWYKRKRTRRFAILGGILAVLFITALIPYPLYVTEPCVVSPIDRAEVRAQIEGIIAEIFVREGDTVEIGTPLVRLDDRDLTYNLKQAQADADRYQANLAKVKGGSRPQEIKRAQAAVAAKAHDVRFAEGEAKRQQKMFNDGVASAMARDEARRDLDVKRSLLSEAQAELRLIQAGSRSEEVSVAEAELRKVEAEIDFLKKQMDNLLVRSPIAGRVLTPRFHERMHARVNPGDFVCEIGNGETVRVDIFVPESDADVIRVGHPVTVKVKSYPLEAFAGRVSLIASAVEEVENQRVIRVETTLDNERGLLRPRMSGYAEIDTGDRPLAVRIFRRALRWLRVRFLL